MKNKRYVDKFPPPEISTKSPFVLIKRLEGCELNWNRVGKFVINNFETENIKSGEVSQMKRRKSDSANGYAEKGETSNYSYEYQRRQETADRKSVIIGMPKCNMKNSYNDEDFNTNKKRQAALPFDCAQRQNIDSKVTFVSHAETGNYNNTPRDRTSDMVDGQLCTLTNRKYGIDHGNTKESNNKQQLSMPVMDKTIGAYNVTNNKPERDLPFPDKFSSLKQSSPKRFVNTYTSSLGKPIAHVEPFVSDLKMRLNQEPDVVPNNKKVSSESGCQEETKGSCSKSNGLKSNESEKELQLPKTTLRKRGNSYDIISKGSNIVNEKDSLISTSAGNSEPGSLAEAVDLSKKWSGKSDRPLNDGSHIYSRKHITENISSIRTGDSSIIENSSMGKISRDKNVRLNSISRSLSFNDLKVFSEKACIKSYITLSLPDLTSIEVTETSLVQFKEETCKKSEDLASSCTSTTDDIDMSEESSTDNEGKSLQVDVLHSVDSLSFGSRTDRLQSQKLIILEDNKNDIDKWKNKRHANHKRTLTKCRSNKRSGNPNDTHERNQKRRISDKRKQKSNGTVINQIRLQQQVLSEQERGKRLAQELPGYNWLEEKIRNKGDSSKIEANNQNEKYASRAVRRDSCGASLVLQSSSDLKSTNKPIPALIPDTKLSRKQQNPAKSGQLEPSSSPSDYQPTLNVFAGSRTAMTLNTVTSSTPRHSPSAEEIEKETESASGDSKHEVQNEQQSNPVNYLKRHIQPAVPPLIPTYKVTALPKQPRKSIELAKSTNNKIHDEADYETDDYNKNRSSTQKQPLQRQTQCDGHFSTNNIEDAPVEEEHFSTDRRKSNNSHDKLSILKEAFKTKLNCCSELQSAESKSQTQLESNDISDPPKMCPIPERSPRALPEEDNNTSRRNSKSEGTITNSPSSESEKESSAPEPRESSVTDSLLGQILMQDNKNTITSPLVIATLLEELMKTRKEVEKLRKVQEQMLKGEKFYGSGLETERQQNNYKQATERLPSENQKQPPELNEVEEINIRPSQAVCKSKAKRESPMEQIYPNKKLKTHSTTASDEPNTITIRYTLPQHPPDFNPEADEPGDGVKLRNMLGIHNNDIDVLPVDKRPSFQRQDVSYARKLSSENVQLKYPHDKNLSTEEPYKNELMKLLASNTCQRPLPPELPNLIPSNNCPPSAFQKSLPFYGEKASSNMDRYPYPHPSSSLPPKQANQSIDQYGYYPRFHYENRNASVSEGGLQVSPNNKMSLIKHLEKPHSAVSHRLSPTDREVMSTRNDRYSNVGYTNQYSEKNLYETKIAKPKMTAPSPQTFQPKILIPPESNNSHYKEWQSNVHHASSVVDTRPYQRMPAQASIHVNPIPSSIVSSTYHYKPGLNTKVTDIYPSHKAYPPIAAQCNSSAIIQNREHSRSPVDQKSSRLQNCINPFTPSSVMAQSSVNAYYSHLRSMQPTVPAIVNPSHSQYSQLPNRHPVASKHAFYDQRPVIQPPHGQKTVQTFEQRSYSPPTRRDSQPPPRYVLSRPPATYETRPIPVDDHKKSSHQSNNLSPDISQPRIVNTNQTKQFQDSVNSSSLRLSPPNASTDNLAGKLASKKCLICGRLAQFLCSGCKLGWYCSKECQREHWNAHSPSCTSKR